MPLVYVVQNISANERSFCHCGCFLQNCVECLEQARKVEGCQ